MKTHFERQGSRLSIRVDPTLYNEDTVFKCFYWYGDEFDVEINRADDDRCLQVTLKPKEEAAWDKPQFGEALEARIKQDLIDFKTRDIISKETKTTRELLIAKAFAHSDEFVSPPPGEISDPVGFDVESYAAEDD